MVETDQIRLLLETRERIQKHLKSSGDILESYLYDKDDLSKGFVNEQHFRRKKDNHIATTAQCLRFIIQSKHVKDLNKQIDPNRLWSFFQNVIWESGGVDPYNLYVAPLVLFTSSKLNKKPSKPAIMNQKQLERIRESLKNQDITKTKHNQINLSINYIIHDWNDYKSKEKIPTPGVNYEHGFILHWMYKALSAYKNELINNYGQQFIIKEIIKTIENSLYEKIALYHSGCSTEFDVVQLAYNLLTMVQSEKLKDKKFIKKAIEIIFDEQQTDGTWKLSRPFLLRSAGGESRSFSIEVATAILKIEMALYTSDEPYFGVVLPTYLPKLIKTLDWVDSNFQTNDIHEKPNPPASGWRSDAHWREGEPESWATALVYEFLDSFLSCINICKNHILKISLNAQKPKKDISWKDLVYYEYKNKNFKNSIDDHIIKPFNEARNLEKSSILLFGPPGNGKTTIAESIANELDWPVIKIYPSDFLIEGPYDLIKIAKSIFNKLFEIENAVVLFDEFEQFLRSRQIEGESFIRFTTTSMLPWLQTLKENGKVISILTTNHIADISKAAKRPGRFDLILPVGPPNTFEQKSHIVDNFTKKYNITSKEKELIARVIDDNIAVSDIKDLCDHLMKIRNDIKRNKLNMELIEKEYREIRLSIGIENEDMIKFITDIETNARW